ncbi:MAG: transporter substrate-binding domain-containing protein [Methylocystaceae bacterium]|nr:transporter substrate-binding domain-containing protein [Methylocystaceae bacterium]
MKHLYFFIIALVLVFTALCTTVRANDTKEIMIVVPYIKNLLEKNSNSKWQGALLGTFKEIEQKTGLKIKFKVLPFARAVAMTENDEADLGIFIESPIRSKLAVPLAEISKVYFVVASLKKTDISSINDLKGKVVATASQSIGDTFIDKLPHRKTLHFNSHGDLIKPLLSGKVDAIFTPDFRLVEMMEKENLSYDILSKPIKLSERRLMLYGSHKFVENSPNVSKIKALHKLYLRGFGSDHLYAQYK